MANVSELGLANGGASHDTSTLDPLTLCDTFNDPWLLDALRQMPRLCTLTIARHSGIPNHGIRWSAMSSLLALPQLCALNIQTLLICPEDESIADFGSYKSPHIHTISYSLHDDRERPRYYSSERAALELMLGAVTHTLQTLVLPAEPTPFHNIAVAYWPQMRELRLRGELSDRLSLPLISTLSGMPRLRILSLDLAANHTIDHRHLIWPAGVLVSYPWPELTELTVSFPHPDDELYSHLPPTLRKLSLCCWPHIYERTRPWYQWDVHPSDELGWQQTLPTSSETLKILSRCRTPFLSRLAIEYQADASDSDMLSCLTSSFPRLQFLELYRYRDPIDDIIPVVRRLSFTVTTIG